MTTPWRNDPLLSGKFHASYPDDIQVIVHAGGPRLSTIGPELMWVRLAAVAPQSRDDRRVYLGGLLNRPHRLPDLNIGDILLVLPAAGSDHPIRTTEQYLEERLRYDVEPCDKCSLAELFDAPSALIAKVFPNIPPGAMMERFTSFCPRCGGVQQVVAKKQAPAGEAAPPAKKPWWKFF